MKLRSEFVCQQCGYKSASFLGKCPNCGEWNSLVETVLPSSQLTVNGEQLTQNLIKLSEVKSQQIKRIPTGFSEFDRVLGGGIVPGSIVLISGEPGIGKSTLLLQCAMHIVAGLPGHQGVRSSGRKKPDSLSTRIPDNQHSVLYVTAEESAQQVKLRSDRISKPPENLYILATTNVEAILAACYKVVPRLAIVDSIQTIFTDKLTGSAGSVGQVRECAQILQRLAKSSGVPIFIVGHVTKEGSIAGPKVLEHLVDAVCNLEGDGMHSFRLLRSLKNRFGSTFEVGVFEMRDSGLVEVANPSEIFLAERSAGRVGSVVTSTIAGGRPILAEVQALCTSSLFGLPTRRVTGLDFSRVQIVLAALSRTGVKLNSSDVYVNVAGGLKIGEPAADLSAALAVASAAWDKPIEPKICAFGEVGLLGELRSVNNFDKRKAEAKRMGFSDIISSERFSGLEAAIRYACGA
ncbi:DNA repair protein RadA [Candidatus Curtissbacteria bacterium]|nr:DNA repair protein RadA [Candidatus Curtissbacteria bacterium]